MQDMRYTHEQTAEAGRLISAIESVPAEKRAIVAMVAETFINGMKTQEQLTAAGGRIAQ